MGPAGVQKRNRRRLGASGPLHRRQPLTSALKEFRTRYIRAFDEYLVAAGEVGLESAYELGRAAMREGLSILDIAEVHQEALTRTIEQLPSLAEQQRAADLAKEFFIESLSTFDMAQRGFREAQETARLQREHAAQLRSLADAALAINSSRSLEDVLQTVTDKAEEIIGADQCVTSLVASGGADGSRLQAVSGEGHSSYQPGDGGDPELGRAVRATNTPVRMSREQLLQRPRAHAVQSAPVRRGGFLGAPLIARDGRNLGLIELHGKRGQDFNLNNQAILEQLAQMASIAIENLRLYEHEHRIAESLQRSLLPETLPQIPGVALAARFEPGGIGVHVGGDWYDVIRLPNGRVGLAIGDVAGRGVRAAAVMGQLKMALRSYAVEAHPPAIVVDRLNRLIHTFDNPEMVTLVYLVIDPGTASVRFVNAGHPPPLVRSQDGTVTYLVGEHSVPLGATEDADFREHETTLVPGATLVLYTDGLVEKRGASLDQGFERLAAATIAAPHGLEEFCDYVTAAVFGNESRTDDTAVLALTNLGGQSDRFHMDVRAHASELPSVRQGLSNWLKSVGASSAETADVVLACHEACANVVLHASGAQNSFEIDGTISGSELVLSVRDSGTWKSPSSSARGRGLDLIDGLTTGFDVSTDSHGTEVRMRRRLENPHTGNARSR